MIRLLGVMAVSARLQAAVEARVAAGAPGALARIEAPAAGLVWAGSAGQPARGKSSALGAEDAFRAASVTESVTAAVAVGLDGEGRVPLDEPLAEQLAPELLQRWRALDALARTTPRQLLTHTSGVPNYFRQGSFAAQLRAEPRRAWRPVELVDQAATHGTPQFGPGEGFEYSDTGYAIVGILVEQATGRQLHAVYREQVDPATVPTAFSRRTTRSRASGSLRSHERSSITRRTSSSSTEGGAHEANAFIRDRWCGHCL